MTDVMINQIHPPVFEFTNELTDKAKEEIVIKYNFGKDVYSLLGSSGDLSVIPNAFKTLIQLVKLYKKYSAELYNVRKSA
ncbi:MAG: hypothetical protein LC106_06905 [Burkholderiales bacterium]|nr:hypothetical protein [Burkholderiales bacterium]